MSRRSAHGARLRNATVGQLGEDALVAGLLSRLPDPPARVVVGAGDDCAVVRPRPGRLQVLKADAMVENVHFTPETDPVLVGRKAVARCLSDFAAMAADPHEALISIAMPATTPVAWVNGFYDGAVAVAAEFGVAIVGGETSSTPGPITLSVCMSGSGEQALLIRRSRAKAGHVLLVTGELGGSLAGRHLTFTPRIREARWIATHFKPSAMMDLSDGLATDLPRLAAASGTGWRVELNAVPRTAGCGIHEALCDGEDYELLIAMRESDAERCLHRWNARFPGVKLTRIGRLESNAVREPNFANGGYDHFAKRD